MSDDNSADKPYPPSPRKLQKARAKGEVARSNDLSTAASYLGFAIACYTFGHGSLVAFGEMASALLSQSATLSVGEPKLAGYLGEMIWDVAQIFALWLALPAISVLAAISLQRAYTLTGSKLAPKASRINPIANAKNKYGRQGLFEFAKSFAKLCVFCIILALFLSNQADQLIFGSGINASNSFAVQLTTVLRLIVLIAITATVIGLLDYAWQFNEHMRKNRMTHKEMMDEAKEAEGDPELKQRRRQRAQEVASSQMMAEVPKADVIIVNPTHYAVALKWERNKPEAPRCVAKGTDEIARQIRECAQQHGVPVHSDPPVARALHAELKLGQQVQIQHYQAVAAAIRFADRMRKKKWYAR